MPRETTSVPPSPYELLQSRNRNPPSGASAATVILDSATSPIGLGTGGATNAEALGASPSASAGDNTAAIQAALNRTGLVTLTTPGTYLHNAPFVIGSNTHFVIGPGVIVKRAAGTFDFILVTAAYNASPTTVTLTWTSGKTMSVAWTAHGKVVGDFISIQGSTSSPSTYSGTFRVTTVTDANNVVVELRRVPSAAVSGTYSARASTINWSVSGGGTFDYNYASAANSVPSTSIGNMGFMATYSQGWRVENLTFKDVPKYCIYAANYQDGLVRNLHGETNSDGVHVIGPAFGTEIDGVHGYFGDDVVAVSSRDVVGNFVDISYGDIIGFHARHINGQSATSVVQVYSQTGYVIDDVIYEDVSGDAPATLRVYGDQLNGGAIQKLTLRNCPAIGAINVAPYNSGTTNVIIQELNIEDSTIESLTDATSAMSLSQYGIIKTLNLVRLVSNSAFGTSGSATMFSLNGAIDNFIIEGGRYSFGSNGRLIGWGANSPGVKQITLRGANFEGGNSIINKSSTVTDTPLISMDRCYVKGFFDVFAMSTNGNIVMTGNTFDTIGSAIMHLYNAAATAVNVWETGNVYAGGGNRLTIAAGVYNPKTFDCQADISVTGVSNAAGNMANNTQATAVPGTGFVTADGAAWRRVAAKTQAITSAAAPAVNLNLGNNITLTAADATVTFAAPTNVPAAGERVTFNITQDGSGGRAIAWNAAYIFPTAWTNTGNTAGLLSEITFVSNGTKLVAQGANVWHA